MNGYLQNEQILGVGEELGFISNICLGNVTHWDVDEVNCAFVVAFHETGVSFLACGFGPWIEFNVT